MLDVSTSIREPYVLDIKTKQAEVEFMNGESYKFRLVVDVTENKEGHSYRLIIDEKEQLDWLKKRCGYRGFKLQQVLILGRRQIEITQRNGNAFYLNAVHFEGILSVEDKDKFTIGYRSGIGHGKGFGMGMLSLIRY